MGRHSAPDDDGDEQVATGATAAGIAVQTVPGRRPRPGRHAHPDEPDAAAPVEDEPRGLEIIEQVLEAPPGDEVAGDEGRAESEAFDPDAPARPNPVLDVPEAADETTQIAPVVDAERDAPVPEAVTQQIPAVRRPAPVAAPAVDGPADGSADDHRDVTSGATVPAPAPAPTAATSDLALLRSNSTVRARVIAAVLVPFVLYVAVLVTLAEFSLRTFLIWIWVPLISAGVLAGLILDTAQRRPKAPKEPASPDDQTG